MYRTEAQLRAIVFHHIEVWYNRRRKPVYLVFLLALGAVIWIGVRVLRFNLLKNLLLLAQVVFVVILFYFDPGGLFEWFLDSFISRPTAKVRSWWLQAMGRIENIAVSGS